MFPGTDDDRHPDPPVGDLVDLGRDPLDPLGVGAVVTRAQERLARELQQDAVESCLGHLQTQA